MTETKCSSSTQNFNQVGQLRFIQRLRLTVEPGELGTTTDSAGFIISLKPFHHFAIPTL